MTKTSFETGQTRQTPRYSWLRFGTAVYPDHPVYAASSFSFAERRYLLARSGEGGEGAGYLEISRSRREGDPAGKMWAYLTFSGNDHSSPESGEAAVVRALYEGLETGFPMPVSSTP